MPRIMPGAKRTFDVIFSLFLLMAAWPVMAVIWVLVRRDGGPGIFSHERVGKDGTTFGCLKFRTMHTDSARRLADLLATDADARQQWESVRKLDDDPRITRTGRWLRSTSLDELPQLVNVLKGDMSLVGPRPVTREELAQRTAIAQQGYLSVRPGMTGPWQVGGRSDTTADERARMDQSYANDPSMERDIAALARTPMAVISRKGAR